MLSVTCIAPVNIAVIKYCKITFQYNSFLPHHSNTLLFISGGKKDEKLIIPLNDSISATLSTDHVSKIA